MEIRNPARPTEVVGSLAGASSSEAHRVIAAARSAFAGWAALGVNDRAQHMADAIAGIDTFRDEDAELLAREVGKVRHEAWVDLFVFQTRWNLALELADEVDSTRILPRTPSTPVSTMISYQPLGVVTIIVPFNWPAAILGASLPHALLAGNAVIVKPPPSAPLALTRMLERVSQRLPEGVLNIVNGADDELSVLITHADVAKVCFTGSVSSGKRVMELASRSLTRLTLELGGNDAAIFLTDAVLDDEHMDRLFSAIFDTSGQICMNVKRIYVHSSRRDELVAALSSRLARVVLGDPLDARTTMGPLHTEKQKARVEELIAEAKRAGAEVLEFGYLPPELPDGYFVRPAIVLEPHPRLGVVVDEQFGPVIPIMSFETESQAIEAANDSWAGLGGSVWSSSPESAMRVARQLAVGYVWVNDHGATRLDLRAPFGGMKQSGFGREQGIDGVRDFQDTRAVAILNET